MILTTLTLFVFIAIFSKGVYFEYKIKSPVVSFYLAILLMYVYPSFLSIADSAGYGYPVYIEANIFACIYMTFFIFSRYILVSQFGTYNIWLDLFENKIWLSRNRIFLLYVVLLFLTMAFFIIGLRLYTISAILSLNWWDLVKSNSSVVVAAVYLSYMSGGISIYIFFSSQKKQYKIFYFLFFIFYLLFCVFVLKSRGYILSILMPVLMYMIFNYKGRQYFYLAVYFVIIIFLFFLARVIRHAQDINEVFENGIFATKETAIQGSEESFVNAFYYFIANNNNFDGFEQNITLVRVLFFWLPSSISDLKPIDFSYYMHSAYYGSLVSDKGSMHPTIFGDAYGNFGMFGAIFYSTFFAFFITMLEFFAMKSRVHTLSSRIFLFSILSVTMLIFARGAVYNGFMYTIIPFIFYFMLCVVLDSVNRRSGK